jgi:hypothetical protein
MVLRPTKEHLATHLCVACQHLVTFGLLLGILTRVVVHVLQHVRDRSLALSVDTTGELANKTDLLVVTQPLSSCYKTLRTNGGRNTERRGTRAIGVEIPGRCQHFSTLRRRMCGVYY